VRDEVTGDAGGGSPPVRVLISYAHGDPEHEVLVRQFWAFLRAEGVDAVLDVAAAIQRQFWPQWMSEQIRRARFVLVAASAGYKQRAEGGGIAGAGRGVRWEARQLQELLYADVAEGMRKVIPVVLPGGNSADIPDWLFPVGGTTYTVSEYTSEGADGLLRLLTDQPLDREPPLGGVRVRPAREIAGVTGVVTSLRSEVLIRARLRGDVLSCEVSLAGTPLGRWENRLAAEVWRVWQSVVIAPELAGEPLLRVGRLLAGAVFDEVTHRLVADLVARLRPGNWVDVVLAGDDAVLGLPIELLRLTGSEGQDLGPLALCGGVTVRRRPFDASVLASRPLAGPLKILAAVAPPEQTQTENPPLDVEREMQAMLDALSDLAGGQAGQVRILEVASLSQIAEALRLDSYHVLHLSAHGSAEEVELEDEDGRPQRVRTEDLIGTLRDAGVPVGLIVLSSCSGAAATGKAMAGGG
jgi:hypothetical protein